MPSVSKSQQAAMGMALAARRGDMKVSDLKGAALELYKSDISDKDLEDFASTKREGLPKHKMKSLKESILSSSVEGREKLINDWLKQYCCYQVQESGRNLSLSEYTSKVGLEKIR